jgi:hypothetical protein
LKITLIKQVKVEKLEFIGEVSFFAENSPYIELLKNITTEHDLQNELSNKGMTDAAVNNVISKLELLGVLKNGHIEIENIKNGFPENEYGKYSLEVFENDTSFPFKHKNKKIERIDANPWQKYEGLTQDQNLISKVQDKDNKKYKVNKIENIKANITRRDSSDLKIIYENNNWRYVLDNKSFEMDKINFNSLFDGDWDEESRALKIDFESVIKQVNAAKSMEYSYDSSMAISQYGQLTANIKNIPVIPKTLEDAKLWFSHLLKNEIEKKNRYISKEELQSLWSNLMDNKPLFQKFALVFDYDLILKEFGKDSKYYWLLQASIDLYPFANKLHPKSRVVIHDEVNIDLKASLFKSFNIPQPKKLIIVDRWIVNLKQYKALEKIIIAFGNPETIIITQEIQEKRNEKEINSIINRGSIKKIVKAKKDIVHQRYWIIDNEFYQTSESLDFITIGKDSIRTQYTTFELYDKKDLDPTLLQMEIN